MAKQSTIVARAVAAGLAIVFFALNIWAFAGGPFTGPTDILVVPMRAIGEIIPSHRWATVLLGDLVTGWTLTSIMVFYLERRWASALLWILFIFLIGNFVTAIYFLVKLPQLKSALVPPTASPRQASAVR